jgi:hypothetical protein
MRKRPWRKFRQVGSRKFLISRRRIGLRRSRSIVLDSENEQKQAKAAKVGKIDLKFFASLVPSVQEFCLAD